LSALSAIDPDQYRRIVFFTGAGMSAESGVPTYRGRGGIWHKYRWEEYACQEAFDRDPLKVLKFHEKRRRKVLQCVPHEGHTIIARLEQHHPGVTIVTQNIDGLHQRAGSVNVIELHGSLWRLRCPQCRTIVEDQGWRYGSYTCDCGAWLRPDITWFGDYLDQAVIAAAQRVIGECDLFLSIGTSGVVWPAAGFPQLARQSGAYCIEINPEPTEMSDLFHDTLRTTAGNALTALFAIE
jgi:NAD-dependent deacetylase